MTEDEAIIKRKQDYVAGLSDESRTEGPLIGDLDEWAFWQTEDADRYENARRQYAATHGLEVEA